MKNNYSIYKLIDPITNNVRYIGVTTNSLKNRLYQHKYNSKKLKTHSAKWINSLLKKGIEPLIELIEVCNSDNWQEREKYWISFYNNLTNHHEGGKGVVINRNKESINNSSFYKKIPILQLSKNGEFIKEWNSFKEASKFYNKSPNAISMSINNNNLCAGFIWVKKSEFDINKDYSYKKIHYKLKQVYVYDKLGYFTMTFPSLKETSKYFNTTKENLIECIKNKSRFNFMFFSYKKYLIFEDKKEYNIIQQYSLDNKLIKEFNTFSEIDRFFNLKGFFSTIYHRKSREKEEVIWRNYKWKIMKI